MSMTREEAIKWLDETIQDTDTYWTSRVDTLQKELDEQKEVFLLAISALRPVSREQVEKVWKGEWEEDIYYESTYTCTKCKESWTTIEGSPTDNLMRFCPTCGAPMTDEAVEMVMERLEVIRNGNL